MCSHSTILRMIKQLCVVIISLSNILTEQLKDHHRHFFNHQLSSMTGSYKGDNATQQLLYRRMEDLMYDYYIQHHIATIESESSNDFCQRRYVTSFSEGSFCSYGIGNGFGGFLEEMLFAVITNRTFLLTQHDTDVTCMDGFTYSRWIPLVKDIQKLYVQHNCSALSDFKAEHNMHHDNFKCGFWDIRNLIRVRCLFSHHNAAILHFSKHFDDSIPDYVQDRINILFAHSFYDNARFHSYGFVQLLALNMTKRVRDLTNSVLTKTLHVPNSIRISIHIRHYADRNPVSRQRGDVSTFNAVRRKISEISDISTRECFLYFATEWNHTISYFQSMMSTINCTLFFIDRSDPESYKVNGTFVGHFRDHGDYGQSALPAADLYLLSHGDILLGSEISTFSMMIANVVSLQGLRKGLSSTPLYWDMRPYLQPQEYYNSYGTCKH